MDISTQNHIGEIYLIRNKENGKCYVGQALKEVGTIRMKWGTHGRWKSHLREARNTIEKGHKDHCVLLNNAIRKHGENGFEVTTLCQCETIEDMDQKEAQFIRSYNALVPNGYNLNYGGAKGQDSEETREKKRLMRLGQTHDEETKSNISKGQIGNRRTVKKRLHPEDSNLPKYILAIREKEAIVGYMINSFPIGTNTKEYINKGFRNKQNPAEAHKKAVEYLEELIEKYKDIATEIAEIRTETNKQETANKPRRTVERKARSDKAGADKYDMPKYVALRKKDGKEIGFEINSLRIVNDDGSVSVYRKSFQSPKNTMNEKLEMIKAHLEEVKRTHKCLIDEHIMPQTE